VTTGARFVALFFGVGLAIAGLGEAVALIDTTVTSAPGGIAAGGDIKNNTINQTIIQQDPAALAVVVKVLTDQNAATTEARITAEREASALAEKLKLTTEAVIGFLRTLGEQNVPPEKITAKLIEIANQAVATRQRVAALEPDDPATKALVDQAKVELDKGHPDAASALLQHAEEAELASAAQARALAQQASAAADARQLRAAKARESRGDVALTQLHYGEAAGLFGSAASLLPAGSSADRGRLLSRQADALYRQGSEFGDNKALTDSIAIWKEISEQDYPRTKAPLDWAMSQNNLGNALATLGGRESGTAHLEDAVAAYRAALEERTRDRVPLDWAQTQNNLGNALWTLGERESGTARLEAAVAAYRAALEVRTRDRAPLDWAQTQNNLGTALWTLGTRESGTARLEEAVTAYRAALEERTRERAPLDWAMTQMNLGNALVVLGGRKKGTEQLAAAVAAYRSALEERTRERVPLEWAMTQENLGTALLVLGGRESGTTHLEEAVNAYRAALEERTRGRVPLEWAMTQVNLGAALEALGERESGTGHLKEAVAALDACVAVAASDCPLDVIQFARARRDETEAEIQQRSAK
jgi:tetratricopeptide (TPR) repeat protein